MQGLWLLYFVISFLGGVLSSTLSLYCHSSTIRKLLNVKIIDDEEYEKNKIFTVVLEEPILLEVGQRHGELIYY